MDFEIKLNHWLEGCQKLIDQHYTISGLVSPKLVVSSGKRYFKIIRVEESGKSVYAFIDKTNGDVLKPATWNAPAKHARGNIFDESNGLSMMVWYGPAYLK